MLFFYPLDFTFVCPTELITTSASWDFSTEYVKPIELVGPADNELPNGTPCQTSGYGYSEYILGQPAVIASTLQWIDMQCITTAECKKTWRNQTLGPRQQCAEVSGGTSCMGTQWLRIQR